MIKFNNYNNLLVQGNTFSIQSSSKIILFSSSLFVVKQSILTANSIFQLCYNLWSSFCYSLTVQPCDGLTTLSHPMFICIMFHLSSLHLLPFLGNWDPLFHLFSTNFSTSSLLQNVRLAFDYYNHTYFNYWNMAIKILFWQFDHLCGLLLGHPRKFVEKCPMSDRYFIHCCL